MDVLKGSAATVALFLAFVFLPILGVIPGIFSAAPGIYYSLRGGRGTGIAIVAITASILAAKDPAAAVLYLVQAGLITLVMPEFLSRGLGGARSVVYSVAVVLLSLLVGALVYGQVAGADLHARVIKGVQGSIAQAITLYQAMGIKGDELKAMQEALQQFASVFLEVYPALLTVIIGTVAALNLLAVARSAVRQRLPLYTGEFRRYKNPEPLVWLLIAAGFSLLAPQRMVYLAGLNVLIVLCALYGVQGCAVVSHFFVKFSVPRYLRTIAILIAVLQPFLAVAVVVLGIFDLWGDFRTPKNRENL